MASPGETKIQLVERLLYTKQYTPHIVNEESQFIMTTYWWGRGNYNLNTARPCNNFYELLLKITTKLCLNTLYSVGGNYKTKVYNNLENSVTELEDFKKFIRQQSKKYNFLIYEYLNINLNADMEDTEPDSLEVVADSLASRAIADAMAEAEAEAQAPQAPAVQAPAQAPAAQVPAQAPAAQVPAVQQAPRPRKIKNFVNLHRTALEKLEALKAPPVPRLEYADPNYSLTPASFNYTNAANTEKMFTLIMKHAIKISKHIIIELYFARKILFDMVLKYRTNMDNGTFSYYTKNSARKELSLQNAKVSRLSDQLKGIFKQPINSAFNKELNKIVTAKFKSPEIDYNYSGELSNYRDSGLSIYGLLNKVFQFVAPLKYDQMIQKWELECRKFNCNYMTVEIPEFGAPGGYQLAINGKCFFCKKALESAGGRSIVYIDGDMFVRKYPDLFDLNNVDFMARCWGMDPRSSSNLEYSISYDPYTFETSGGIMFFSQSAEAYMLCDLWIRETQKASQTGKADDRLISLVINTYKLLLSMKIVPLPIEYLWLSLDYDYRLMDTEITAELYDYKYETMKNSVIIEHPECLTSEDTATGAGAASDRTPKYYSFLEENIDPVSENFHEFLNFPSKEFSSIVYGSYLKFMSSAYYLDDENEVLVEKEFVRPGKDKEENEQPLYIVKYDNKFGNIKYINKQKYPTMTYNKVAEINNRRASNMNLSNLNLRPFNEDTIEINDLSKLQLKGKNDEEKIIGLILRLLMEGNNVIYNPVGGAGYDPMYYDLLKTKLKSTFRNMEFVFVPALKIRDLAPTSINYFYKPRIMTNQAMYFKPGIILIRYLHMFLSLNDFSKYLGYGSYQFMSHVRVGYLIKDMKLNLMKFPEEVVSMRRPPAPLPAPAPAPAPMSYATALSNTTKSLLSGGAQKSESFIDFEYVDQEDLEIDPSKMVDLYNEGLDLLSRVDIGKKTNTANTAISYAAIFEGGNKRNHTTSRKTRKHRHKYTHKKGHKRVVRKTRKH